MSQHDYVLDNAATSVFFSDVNAALIAYVEANSGGSAPSTIYDHMWWYDTVTDTLAMRNSADSGWLSVYREDATYAAQNVGDCWLATPVLPLAAESIGFTDRVQEWGGRIGWGSAGSTALQAKSIPASAMNAGNHIRVTGGGELASLPATQVGTMVHVQFAAATRIVHDPSFLFVPGRADVTTDVDDIATFVELAPGYWSLVAYRTSAAATSITAVRDYISTSTATGSNKPAFTGLTAATYDAFYIEFDGLEDSLAIELSTNNGSSWQTSSYAYVYTRDNGQTGGGTSAARATMIEHLSGLDSEEHAGRLDIFNASAGVPCSVNVQCTITTTLGGTTTIDNLRGAVTHSLTGVNAIRFTNYVGGNLASGASFRLYGVRG